VISAASTHAKSRGLLLGAIAVLAIGARLRLDSPPPRTLEGVASILGRAAGGAVKPDDFLWEERGGFFADAFVGRRVLFLATPASAGPGAPRDLYRARVRLTRTGRPIAVAGVRNLTRTPLGDDRDLAGSGHRVAFATSTIEGVQGVTLLDLDGEPERPPAFRERVRALLERWLATGSTRGLARTEIAFARPPTAAKLEVAPGALVLSLGEEAAPAAFDFAAGALQTGRINPFAASAQRIPEVVRPAGPIAADLVRATLGSSPARALAALLERTSRLAPRSAPLAAAPEGLRIAADYPTEAGWPPAPLAPVHPKPFDGEGSWHVSPAIQGPAQQVAAPPLLEAMVRPDRNHPDVLVHLIAIDSRRLDVRIEPGLASPRPSTGPHGAGRLPLGPEAKGVVAAFVAGPAPASRPLGFLGEGRLFSPIVSGAPTLAVGPDGRATLGAWPRDAARDAFVVIAQAPDAMDPGGAFAPANAGTATERAALCRTSAGYLVYAFAPDAPAASLQAGLKLAACASALHLGTAPSPVGFAYVRSAADAAGAVKYSGTVASSAMSLPLDRLGEPWSQELAVVTERELLPASFASKKIPWLPDSGTQPAPAWLTSVFALDTEQLGAKVKVLAFMPERVLFRLATGADEPLPTRAHKPGPKAEERGAALVALGLSVSRRASRRGLVIGGTEVVRPGNEAAWLAFDGARASISKPGDKPPSSGDATELPLTADEGKLLPAAREVGTQRPRSALCVLPDGTVVVSHASFDTDEATTEALLEVGCDRVVILDRGVHDGVFVHRAGSERGPDASYDATALYVLAAPGTGTAHDFP
jgi:hypothetical protein